MMFFFLTGCGIKGNPVIFSRCAGSWADCAEYGSCFLPVTRVILKWDFYDKDSKITNIAIEKSEVGSAGNECKDCPRTFKRVGQCR